MGQQIAFGRLGLLGLVFGVGLGVVSCAPPQRETTEQTRDVILVTLDTLRADHLGAYGYPRNTSPVMDRLAAEGTFFRQAFAPMATTVPSHASMFTSRLPLELKVLKNGHRLGEGVPTLAEILAEKGFETAAFVSTDRHFGAGGLDRGFETFDEPVLTESSYRPGAETVARAVQWLEGRESQRPLFLWVHLFDAHFPYHPAHRFEEGTPEERQQLAEFKAREHRLDLAFYGGDPEKMLEIMDLYDGEIRAVDRAVGELEAAVRSAGLASEDPSAGTLWILAGDHGEGLGNHHWAGHGKHIYNEQLRVPLIFHHQPPLAGAGEKPENVVEVLDILPTVLELAGIEMPEGLNPRGVSLVPQLAGAAAGDRKRKAFGQRRHFDPPDPHERKPVPASYEAGEKFTLQDQSFKYQLWTAGEDELYAIDRDPYEMENLIGQGLEEEQAFRREIRRLILELAPGSSAEKVDDETILRLKSLGYDQ